MPIRMSDRTTAPGAVVVQLTSGLLAVGFAVGAMLNGFATPAVQGGPVALGLDLGMSKLVLACIGMGLFRLWQSETMLPYDQLLRAALPVLVASLMRSSDAAWLGLSMTMGLIAWQAPVGSALRNGALILVAVGLHRPLVAIVGSYMGGELLALDARVAALILSLFLSQVFSEEASLYVPGGVELVLVWRCGVLSNLSIALLLWYSATRFFLGGMSRPMLLCAALVTVGMFTSNVLRIAVMTTDQALYELLHDGAGATALRLCTLGGVACVIGIFVMRQRDA